LNGVTTVYDIFGASFPAKFWIKSGEAETNKEILMLTLLGHHG
jgi:hypothetical protein